MTRSAARASLAAIGGSFLAAAALAHWLWHFRRRRLAALALLSGGATLSLTTAAALVPRLIPEKKPTFTGRRTPER